MAPIFRGECNSCHGWTAGQTGSGYRFDFFDVTSTACGDASLALGTGVILAGSPSAAPLIETDVVAQNGEMWPRMPPQPSPALPGLGERHARTVGRSAGQRTAALGQSTTHFTVTNFPATANAELAFTAVIDDPDGDSVLGVIEVNGLAFLMNRPGSFDVSFASATWPTGPQR